MPRVSLTVLDARIEVRARATRADHPWWPCSAGCDSCCRSLPHLPALAKSEWERLRSAIARLSPIVQAEIVARTEQARHAERVVCPLLDEVDKRCRVYDARPIACRTYGFYTDRDAGLHCGIVTEAIATHDATVTWGNGEAIADDMRDHGEPALLDVWLRQL